ncbi:hypothetical protein P3S68_022539 [Capsicum galapagoense]
MIVIFLLQLLLDRGFYQHWWPLDIYGGSLSIGGPWTFMEEVSDGVPYLALGSICIILPVVISVYPPVFLLLLDDSNSKKV